MIAARCAAVLFGLLLSGMMSFPASGLSNFRAIGLGGCLPGVWTGNGAVSWTTAFPVVLVVAPVTRSIVARMTSAR